MTADEFLLSAALRAVINETCSAASGSKIKRLRSAWIARLQPRKYQPLRLFGASCPRHLRLIGRLHDNAARSAIHEACYGR